MKSKHILISLAILLPFFGKTQSTGAGDRALKIYANFFNKKIDTDFQDIVSGNSLEEVSSVSIFEFGQFSPAFSFYHFNGHFSEIELSSLYIRREDQVFVGDLSGPFPGKTSAFALGIRYGYNLNLSFDEDSSLRPMIGLSAIPFLETTRSDPDNKALYNIKRSTAGLLGQLVPRLMIHLDDHFVLDINVPVTAVEISTQSLQLDGAANLRTQKESRTEVRGFPNRVHVRIGVGVLF